MVFERNFEAETSEVNHVINLEKQPFGEYLVQVVSNHTRQTVKVVKVD